MPVHALYLSPLPRGLGEHLQDLLRVFPPYTRVCNADAVFQPRFAFCGNFLRACSQCQYRPIR